MRNQQAAMAKEDNGSIIQPKVAAAAQLTFLGAVCHMATLEKSLTAINDELAVLPGGLSRILGITSHLNIPAAIPVYQLYTGFGIVGAGLLIMLLSRRKSGDRD